MRKPALTAKLISAFAFATRIVQSLYFLNPEFQAPSHLLTAQSGVCQTWSETPKSVFLTTRLICGVIQVQMVLCLAGNTRSSKGYMNLLSKYQVSRQQNYINLSRSHGSTLFANSTIVVFGVLCVK